jgi:hypothetical protein
LIELKPDRVAATPAPTIGPRTLDDDFERHHIVREAVQSVVLIAAVAILIALVVSIAEHL